MYPQAKLAPTMAREPEPLVKVIDPTGIAAQALRAHPRTLAAVGVAAVLKSPGPSPAGAVMAKTKRGRPRAEGERYACGKRKPSDAIAPAIWQRILTEAKAGAADPKLATELGRLSLHGLLTASQTSAGFKVAEIYGRFERWHGLARNAASPSYQMGSAASGSSLMSEDERTEAAERAQVAFLRLQEEIPAYPIGSRELLEMLCVDDRAVLPVQLDHVKAMLDHLVRYFGVRAAAKPSRKLKRLTA
jgi:hypothetical protein